ncbi:MAG: biotin--[acetyl-CoA-carboxylase] ligase [Endomicrobium sp.]|jgi:BirA family biotin operon repressor/biotin-[acetyl-CoA-carboxylase] ligase|nr:biotin--[acetyl-CoA-carboxylase] ligase [Endomicrobium sp.]
MHILETLSRGVCVPGTKIALLLNVSRAAVHKQINVLRKNGYVISSSKKGYTLVKEADVLNENEIKSFFKKLPAIAEKIICYSKINSTQTKIKSLAETAQNGLVICAQEQTQGYGRRKSGWSSNKGGLWFSFLLKPKIAPNDAPKIALIISVAINRVLKRKYNLNSKIKWPNDILADGKKLCGIITEMSAEDCAVNWIAAGVGINVSNDLPKELKNDGAVLKDILNIDVCRAELLADILTEIDKVCGEFFKYGFSRFCKEYNDNCAYINEAIFIDAGFDIIKGINLGVDETGALLLKTEKQIEKIISGTLRKL